MDKYELTKEEQLFCELYATGDAPFAGDPARCYMEVFHDNTNRAKNRALRLLARKDIQAYLDELGELGYEEAKFMKKFLTQNLMNIVSECSHSEFRDRRGTLLSPAPLRSVAVNASKALMDLYPVKEAQVNKLSIDGAGDGGITFNVIMPEKKNMEDTLEKD